MTSDIIAELKELGVSVEFKDLAKVDPTPRVEDEEQGSKASRPRRYSPGPTWEMGPISGPDFTVFRKQATKTSILVVMPTKKKAYIQTVTKKGEVTVEPLDWGSYQAFFRKSGLRPSIFADVSWLCDVTFKDSVIDSRVFREVQLGISSGNTAALLGLPPDRVIEDSEVPLYKWALSKGIDVRTFSSSSPMLLQHFGLENTRTLIEAAIDTYGISQVGYLGGVDFARLKAASMTDFKAFAKYITADAYAQGYSNICSAMDDLAKYYRLCLDVHERIDDKYPKYLASMVKRLSAEYERNKDKYLHISIAKAAVKYAWLEGDHMGYEFYLPKSMQDFTREGSLMHNCVGRYHDYHSSQDKGNLMVFIRKNGAPYIDAFLSISESGDKFHGFSSIYRACNDRVVESERDLLYSIFAGAWKNHFENNKE